MNHNELLVDIITKLESKEHDNIIEMVRKYPHAFLLFNSIQNEYINSLGKMNEYNKYFLMRTSELNEDYSDAKFSHTKGEE